jgi:hypothetical protein
VGFEPIIPAFERAKTVHALDRVATVLDVNVNHYLELTRVFRFKPAGQLVARHHSVVSCALSMEDLVSDNIVIQ